MPAAGQTTEGSLRTLLRDYLAAHPGKHKPKDVATALGHESSFYVANELGRMARRDEVQRENTAEPGRQPAYVYSANPTT